MYNHLETVNRYEDGQRELGRVRVKPFVPHTARDQFLEVAQLLREHVDGEIERETFQRLALLALKRVKQGEAEQSRASPFLLRSLPNSVGF